MRAVRSYAVARAIAHAPFLAMLAEQRAGLVDLFVAEGSTAALAACAPMPGPDDDVVTMLRRRRCDLALVLALADLAGEHDLTQTVHALTDFADAACDAALTAAFAERVPDAAPAGFAIIALGKQGSRELNYSSDIDPILIFDPATLPRRERDDPGEAAVRIARRWVDILSSRTGDGHVQRVDLRLRPSPEVTPIVLPVEAAISYYESQALPWEQAAFIRSRACAGDTALGRHFLDQIQPFIWRRSLDFGQVKRIADISSRIRDAYAGGQAFGPGFDLKRGRGGIREVEFFAQVHQLIHGGRNPALRVQPTCEALMALAAAGHVEEDVAEVLCRDYVMLRTIEHRLQMIDDQQTHSLPDTDAALDRLAALHGLESGSRLIAMLSPVVAEVGAAFDQLTAAGRTGGQGRWPTELEAGIARAEAAGFADGAAAMRRVEEWRSGHFRVLRSPAALEALEDVLPALLDALGAAQEPDATLIRFDRMIAGLPSAVGLFNLLAARPQLLTILVAVLGHAPTLAADLAVRPDLIEGLIDASVFSADAARDAIDRLMTSGPGAGDEIEPVLDHVRRIVGEQRFALGVQLVEGVRDPLLVARDYATLADAALTRLTETTVADFERSHGRVAGGELLILALGRYGGQALTQASDLDLILLFTGDHLAESDGDRPLGATRYFNRLGQRVVASLSVPTAAGRLYEIDTRLRPQGTQGPLVSAVDAFARYQAEEAWTWEHMALTRARPVFGSAAARARLEAIVDDVLHRPRDIAQLHADIVKMRADMAAHKQPSGPMDVKLIDGGLVDAEFAIHALQLRHRTGFASGLAPALTMLVDAGLAPAHLLPALDLLSRMLVTMRLMAPDGEAPTDAGTRARIARACLCDHPDDQTWSALLAAYGEARQAISQWWSAIRDTPFA